MNTVVSLKNKDLIIGSKPLVMGIVNVTPDSFSDGGFFLDKELAIKHANFLVKCGADIIDIGGESTKPFSCSISIDEEIDRVLPVIEGLSESLSVPISIDTTKSKVAEEAINAGASIINDVSGLSFDEEMANVAAKNRSGLVLMHMRGSPMNMQIDPVYDDLIEEIKVFLENSIKKALKAGVDRASIIIDPGIGFGKTIDHNFEILKNLNKFSSFGLPLLVGPSRKSFIRNTLKNKLKIDKITSNTSFLEVGTQASVAVSSLFGADIVRVHDVLNTRITLEFIESVKNI